MSKANVKIVGPGYWNSLHLLARHAQDPVSLQSLDMYMKFMQKHFPCQTCRTHVEKYFKDKPIATYKHLLQQDEKGQYTGPFRYTFEIHNVVNENLKKPILSWDLAYSMYFDETCTEFCAGVDDLSEPPKRGYSIKRIEHVSRKSRFSDISL